MVEDCHVGSFARDEQWIRFQSPLIQVRQLLDQMLVGVKKELSKPTLGFDILIESGLVPNNKSQFLIWKKPLRFFFFFFFKILLVFRQGIVYGLDCIKLLNHFKTWSGCTGFLICKEKLRSRQLRHIHYFDALTGGFDLNKLVNGGSTCVESYPNIPPVYPNRCAHGPVWRFFTQEPSTKNLQKGI